MVDHSQEPPAVDPDNVPETACFGRFNVITNGAVATLTFTHVRPKAGPLIDSGQLELQSVVRARVAMFHGDLASLRDVITQVLDAHGQGPAAAGGGGGGKLN
jgi:hypothetical protein